MKAAKAHVASGRRFVVDMDLEKFFDRVNHDVLMARVARKVGDKQVPAVRRTHEKDHSSKGVVSLTGQATFIERGDHSIVGGRMHFADRLRNRAC